MYEYERRVCRSAGHIVAVSETTPNRCVKLFGVTRVSEIADGGEPRIFCAAAASFPRRGPGLRRVDGLAAEHGRGQMFSRKRFCRSFAPAAGLHARDCRSQTRVQASFSNATRDSGYRHGQRRPPISVGQRVSIVPLRIGGGTRLKIYESMAAGTPVVSTTVGAEGLDVSSPENILLADTPQTFADACLRLLEDAQQRRRISAAAHELVSTRFSWDAVADRFADALQIGAGAER